MSSKYKNIANLHSIIFDHSGIKLEINNNKQLEKLSPSQFGIFKIYF